ncbi:UNVERIFIED_CONTAM: hypothetical protein PYX00_004071 [Menopon gallinae]|uniref:1-acyl-sn-glycerol-3-phosphate acyltransferase n=1 Tax=Menopon gallinae TaxID=328185 RepID=A0AAW2I374_9NEOP
MSGVKLEDWFFYAIIIVILILPYICKKIHIFIYFGKYVLYCSTLCFLAIGCIPLFALNAKNVKNCLYISEVIKHVTKFVGIEWELRDLQYVSEDRGAIIVANHQTIFDVLGMHCYWHVMVKCAAIAKKELFYFWPFGLAAWLGGVVFIDRKKGSESYNTLFETAQLMHVNKTKLFIFPEGTRNNRANRTLQFLPFKRGAFKMAIAFKVPILPIVYSPYYFLDLSTLHFGSGKVIVKGLPPISTENLTEDDVDTLMQKTRETMLKTFEELSAEVASFLPDDHFMKQAYLAKNKLE